MTDLAYIAIIIALVSLGAYSEYRSAKRNEETETQANATINLLFSHLEASREREGKVSASLIATQNQMLKKQHKVIESLHTRLAQPDAQAAADLTEQYEKRVMPAGPPPAPADPFNPPLVEYELDDIDPLSVPRREAEPIEL